MWCDLCIAGIVAKLQREILWLKIGFWFVLWPQCGSDVGASLYRYSLFL